MARKKQELKWFLQEPDQAAYDFWMSLKESGAPDDVLQTVMRQFQEKGKSEIEADPETAALMEGLREHQIENTGKSGIEVGGGYVSSTGSLGRGGTWDQKNLGEQMSAFGLNKGRYKWEGPQEVGKINTPLSGYSAEFIKELGANRPTESFTWERPPITTAMMKDPKGSMIEHWDDPAYWEDQMMNDPANFGISYDEMKKKIERMKRERGESQFAGGGGFADMLGQW